METSTWLPLQALGTLLIVIALAFWSYRRTRKKHDEHPEQKSALARDTPDPQFRPDSEVTDPHHVTDAHPADRNASVSSPAMDGDRPAARADDSVAAVRHDADRAEPHGAHAKVRTHEPR